MERRNHKGSIELREQADQPPVIAGYAAVFNSPSFDMGFIETIDPGAFNRTINAADVRGLGNHDVNWLLGRAKSGTLRLFVDGTGLGYEVTVNAADPDGVRALEKVRRGDWDGSSFSFQTIRDEWTWDSTPPQRRLLEVALIDVGPVTFPAYPDATANARDLKGALEPIAKRCGRPVDDLVAALQRGEIRSLVESDTPPLEHDLDEHDLDDGLEDASEAIARLTEQRAGKTISAATREVLEGAIAALTTLLGNQTQEDDSGEDDGGDRSYRELLQLRERELQVLQA